MYGERCKIYTDHKSWSMYSRGKANVEAGDKQKGENERRNCTRRIIYGILEVGVGS